MVIIKVNTLEPNLYFAHEQDARLIWVNQKQIPWLAKRKENHP